MINWTIFKYTIMSACLDPMKLLYVLLLGFVAPIGMKVASLMHGASDSQTFEMLTGKVGVSFVLMVLCLGLAGNSATQSGRGGEYLPLLFTRPVSKAQYVLTKWAALTAIGASVTVLQNIVVTLIGATFGEVVTPIVMVSICCERFLDAALISAAMLLTMLNKNPLFQIVAIIAFYVWMTGQTIPPVSVASATPGTNELSLQATKLLLSGSQIVAEMILPTINVYDLLSSQVLRLGTILAYVSMLSVYLLFSVKAINKREFFYGTN